MYVFVRSTGYALLFLGLLFILLGLVGLGGAVYVYTHNDAAIAMINTYIFANSSYVMPQQDIRFLAILYGLGLFLFGILSSAFGQLLLVFIDIAVNTRETNALLRRRDL